MSRIAKEDFNNQIRQAMQNLHDFAYLQKLPLTGLMRAPTGTLDQAVRRLRSEILDAIESLNPPGNMPARAKERRPYVLLYGHYVQGVTTAELAEELAISIRQLRREHARAVDAVVDFLWVKLSDSLAASAGEPADPPDVTDTETEQLINQAQVEDINLNDLVNGVLATLTPLAGSRKVTLANALPESLPLARANRVVLRQAMLGLVSFAIQRFSCGEVVIKSNGDPDARLWVQASGTGQMGEPSRVGLEVSRKLVASLGGAVKMVETGGSWQAEISLPAAEEIPLLVMDDNAGLIELYRRYLARRGYRVFEAHTSNEVIDIAEKQPLRLIILDVMMPEQDGWEVLQRLKNAPAVQSVPVMICSVLDETGIAQALGASDYLRKPVTQEALLAKVEYWCRGPL